MYNILLINNNPESHNSMRQSSVNKRTNTNIIPDAGKVKVLLAKFDTKHLNKIGEIMQYLCYAF